MTGFWPALRAEWTKFRTVRGWVVGLLVAVGVTVLVGLLGPLGSSISCAGPDGGSCADRTPPVGPGGQAVVDGFYFVHQPLAGDGSITVRVTSLTGWYPPDGRTSAGPDPTAGLRPGVRPWAKAGVMIKESTRPGSAYAAVLVTGEHGVRMQHDYTHDTAGLPGQVTEESPRWLRLTRAGDLVTGYDSVDGATWNEIGTADLSGLPATVHAGMFVSSPEYVVLTPTFAGVSGTGGPTLATAGFDQVSRQGAWPAGEWTGVDVGGPGGADRPGVGFERTGDGFTVSGSGDIAPAVAGRGALSRAVENSLVGVFAGLVVVIVVATMFVTAEYRRGLIRTTFAATPRRGRLLAAKAVVVGSVAFVAGLASAGVALLVVGWVAEAKGFPTFPVSGWTEVRVVVGTAALLAATAVLALAVGTLLRRSAAAVTSVVVATVLPYLLAVASVLPAGAAEWLLRLTPAAGFAVQQSLPEYPQVDAGYTPADGYFPLPPAAGFAVLCGYAALAITLAAVVVRRRDG